MKLAASAKQQHPWLRWAQIPVMIGLMGWLLRRVEWASLPPLIANLHWQLVVLGITLLLISHLINVARWRYLLQHRGPGYGTLLVYYGAGLFGNNFLPTGVGGDGMRIMLLSRSVPLQQAALSVALDRGIGLIALTGLLGMGLWIGVPPNLGPSKGELATAFSRWEILALGLLLTAAICLLSLVAWHELLSPRRVIGNAVVRFTHRVGRPSETIGHWVRLLAGGYVLSVLSHLCIVTANWVMLQAMGVQVALDAAIWLVLAVTVSLLFPLAINGLGVREAAYVTVLGAYGIVSTPALLAALLTRVVAVLLGLAGGTGWLLHARFAEIGRAFLKGDRRENLF